jgi:hypothetical protein
MRTLTRNALAELTREKDYTPEAMTDFLRTRDRFMSAPTGLRRELEKMGIDCAADEAACLAVFKDVLKAAGFSKDERKHASKWLVDGALPSPKYNYPIRLCFAFGLNGQDALDFLWKTCLVNGFNFRKAEDVIYCYCLERGKSYADAQAMLAAYKAATADEQYADSDYTKRTHTLRSIFSNLSEMDERDFMGKLCAYKKNFIAYSVTAHEAVLRLADRLKAFYRADIADHKRQIQYSQMPGYDYHGHGVALYNELIYAFDVISQAARGKDTPFGELMKRFPQNVYLNEMLRVPAAATDMEHDKARKTFILLYFADYALAPPVDGFFADFVIALNTELDRCGYAKLYPANPFDWHILNCIRSLDYNDQAEDLNPIELFNDVLELLAAEAGPSCASGDEYD